MAKKKITLRSSIALVLLFLYASVLSVSNILYYIMLLPLCLELWRNKHALRKIFFQLLVLNIFLIVLVITLWFMNEQQTALLIYLRSNMSMGFALLLFCDKNAFDIALGFQELRLPKTITSLFYFTAKFIYIVKQNIIDFRRRLLVRGFHPTTSLFTYQTYANFIGLLFIIALKKANNLQNLMIIRGFQGQLYTLKESKSITLYEIALFISVLVSIVFKKGVI